MTCKALITPDTNWNFCPASGPNILFLILFTLTTMAHLGQAIYYRKPYCWVIVTSGVLQILTYAARQASIQDPANFGAYAAWFVFILIAPLWTNAFAYMVFGRMVWNYKDSHQMWKLKAWHFGLVFVTLDIIAFIVQIGGAVVAVQDDAPTDEVMRGLHIYMGGVGIQQLFILLFCGFSFRMFFDLRKDRAGRAASLRGPMILLSALYATLALVTLRIIFRLCEYSQGLDSQIPRHEAYQYCLDSLPMFIALVIFNVIHPGRIMAGKDAEMPSFRERRKQKGTSATDVPLTEQLTI